MKKTFLFLAVIFCTMCAYASDFHRNEEIIKSILSEAENAAPSSTDMQAPAEPPSGKISSDENAAPAPGEGKTALPGAVKPAPQKKEKKEKKKKAGTANTGKGAEEEMLSTAVEMYKNGYMDDSLRILASFREKYPSSQYLDTARIWTGRVYLRKLDYAKAMEEFGSIAETSGEFPAALFENAGCYVTKGETNRAIEAYTRLSVRFPTHPKADDALLRLADLYGRSGHGNEAVGAAIRIIRDYPDRDLVDDAYYYLGHIYETDPTIRDFDLARRFYRLFMKKAGEGVPVFANSPLRSRVESDLKVLEKRQFRMTD